MGSTRAVLQVFESYQKARVSFVQTVAELATRPQNIEALQNAGVMSLLRPLLLDSVPSIQQVRIPFTPTTHHPHITLTHLTIHHHNPPSTHYTPHITPHPH